MNKSELINALADETGLNKTDAGKALESFIGIVVSSLKKSESVAISGFGTFLARERKARKGRNPATGDTIDIAASRVPAFKPSKTLKTELN